MPSGNKQLSKPMSTRTEFNIAIWCHQDTFCGIMTPYNDIDLVQIGSGNEWLDAWRCQSCSALSHYLNKLKGRWFETSWRPCCVTVKTMLPLRWRHNDYDSVSNHQPHGCLLNRLFGHRSKKTSKLRVTGLCAGNSPGPVNSPHKGPVTRKMFPFDYVIMTKRDFGTTNNWIPSERVWGLALILARACCWTNSRVTGDWKHHDAHVASL